MTSLKSSPKKRSRSFKSSATKKSTDRLRGARALARAALAPGSLPVHTLLLEEAHGLGLLDGTKSEHVSFRAPPALLEAAKRETGVKSTTELGLLALAMLARPDPVARYMKRNRGKLGADHKLEY
jgi:hypothetical protein